MDRAFPEPEPSEATSISRGLGLACKLAARTGTQIKPDMMFLNIAWGNTATVEILNCCQKNMQLEYTEEGNKYL